MVKINPNADIAGIMPKTVAETPITCTLVAPEDADDCVTMETRTAKAGGTFTQYALHLQDAEQNSRIAKFLFDRHLAPLAKAWGEDSVNWIGESVTISAESVTRKGEQYWELVLEPVNAV